VWLEVDVFMKYDIKMHIPQQIEHLLAAETNSDIDLFIRSMGNLKEMLLENGFIHDLHDYENERDAEIIRAKDDYVKAVKDVVQSQNNDEIIVGIAEAGASLEYALQAIHDDFMNTVKMYVISYLSHVDINYGNE